MLIFQGLPGKSRAGSPKRTRNPLPNPTQRSPGGSRRPPEAPGAKNSRLRSAPRPPDQSQADKEWEFRALARNPKRYKVGWMPA